MKIVLFRFREAWCLNPYITNWYLKLLKNRTQRVCFNNFGCDWKLVNKGTTQGSVSVRYLFNIFVNDLNITIGNHDALFKYADDSTIIAPVRREVNYSDQLVPQFLDWTNTNRMSCNPSKCKELTIKKRENWDLFSPTGMIASCKEVDILGVTFQWDSKFSVHVKKKLIEATKFLHILRTLRKEGYNLSEIDLLLNTIILLNINYALSVYAASESDLTPVQCFLYRCFKRYTSKPESVYDLLERQDRKSFGKVPNTKGHLFLSIMRRVKPSSYNLRKETCFKPKINTMRFTFLHFLLDVKFLTLTCNKRCVFLSFDEIIILMRLLLLLLLLLLLC